jgi:hypothetical protein
VEKLAACAAHDGVCTEEDAAALQAGAEKTLWDLTGLLKSGNMRALVFTAEEGEALRPILEDVRGRFAHIAILDGPCNTAIQLVSDGLYSLANVIYWSSLFIYFNGVIGAVLVALYAVPVLVLILARLLLVLPTLTACLFWWL